MSGTTDGNAARLVFQSDAWPLLFLDALLVWGEPHYSIGLSLPSRYRNRPQCWRDTY
jgi:hypothetical protein